MSNFIYDSSSHGPGYYAKFFKDRDGDISVGTKK